MDKKATKKITQNYFFTSIQKMAEKENKNKIAQIENKKRDGKLNQGAAIITIIVSGKNTPM